MFYAKKKKAQKRKKTLILEKWDDFEKLVKIAIKQRLQSWQKGQFGLKIKIDKDMRKTTLQAH